MFRKVEISHKTIIFTAAFILSLVLVYLLKDLILELFVALLLMIVLDPLVSWMSRYRIPRVMAVLLSYILVIAVFAGVVSLILPAIVEQTGSFIDALPGYVGNIGLSSELTSNILQGFLNSNVGSAPGAIFQFTFSVLNNIVSILTVLVFAFYMLLSRAGLVDQLGVFFGEEKKKGLAELIDTLENRLGSWARGQLLLMFAIGVITYIGLTILGIPYSLPLAVLAGILEIVPFLGPIISAIPAVIIGLGISPITGVGTAALYFLIQQIEGYVLVPKVMQKSAGVSPLLTLIALAVGSRLAGIVGAIISVPVVIALQVISKKYLVKE